MKLIMINKHTTMKKYIYTIILFALPLYIHAQDIEGIELNTKMTYEQVVEKFGEPDEVKVWDADWPEGTKQCRLYYGKNFLVFSEVDGLIGFGLTDNRFAAIINYMEGGIRIGDPLSKVQNVNIFGPLKKRGTWPEYNSYNLFSETDCPLWISEKDGVIIGIGLSIPL